MERHLNSRSEELPLNKLDLIYVSLDGKLSSPRHNRDISSDDIIDVTSNCPEGTKVVSGNCRWNIMRATPQKTWCRAEDFKVGKRGCSNCVSSVSSVEKDIGGRSEQVVSSLTYSTVEGREKEMEMTGDSCVLLDVESIGKEGMRECGFFCLFHQLDPFYDSETQFRCRYIPPSVFGMDQLLSLMPSDKKRNSSDDKVQVISLDLVCGQSN